MAPLPRHRPHRRPPRPRQAALIGALVVAAVGAAACGADDHAPTGAAGSSSARRAEPATTIDASTDPAFLASFALDERVTLRIGMPSANHDQHAALIVGQHLGVMDRFGIDLEPVNITSAEGRALLARGDLDAQVGIADAGFFNAAGQGLPLHIVASTLRANPEAKAGLWVRRDAFADPEHPTADEVRKIRFATSGGPTSATMLVYDQLVEDGWGLRVTDLDIIQMNPPDQLLALQQGSIQAGYLISPFWRAAMDDPSLLYWGYGAGVTDISQRLANLVIVGPRLERQPEIAEALLAAMQTTALTFLGPGYLDDPAVLDALAKGTGQSAEVLQRSTVPVDFRLHSVDPALLDAYQDTFELLDVLPNRVDVDKVLDLRPLEAIAP